MRFLADLHIHSHFSRATSRDLTPPTIHRWAAYKGLRVVGTGDFAHPGWREELESSLEPCGDGLFRVNRELLSSDEEGIFDTRGMDVRFMVTGEISCIYKRDGLTRKVHHLIALPSLEAAHRIGSLLGDIGNVTSDGRPILGLDSRDLLELTLEACSDAIFIPAHIWTPHFSVFGAHSGFDSLEECFGDLCDEICAVETGLSSDPPMNWRLSALDPYPIVSNSDAHSPRKLGREATLFDVEPSYHSMRRALTEPDTGGFQGTVEFFPEEGKYHYDGHRKCGVRLAPSETRERGGLCPVCGKRVTVGVLSRVEELADREEGHLPSSARPFMSFIPLAEVIGDALGIGAQTKTVEREYEALLREFGNEFAVLEAAEVDGIERVAGPLVAEAVT